MSDSETHVAVALAFVSKQVPQTQRFSNAGYQCRHVNEW